MAEFARCSMILLGKTTGGDYVAVSVDDDGVIQVDEE